MFDLRICAFDELPYVINTFDPTHIISTINTIDPLPGKHLHINVGDITSPIEGHVLPTMDHLLTILKFTEELSDDDRLLIHCLAGQSRSTAFAIGVLIQHGMDYAEAFDHVAGIRSILLPNRLIIKLIDEHFNLQGDLQNLVTDYYRGEFKRMSVSPLAPAEQDVEWMAKINRILRRLGRDT